MNCLEYINFATCSITSSAHCGQKIMKQRLYTPLEEHIISGMSWNFIKINNYLIYILSAYTEAGFLGFGSVVDKKYTQGFEEN